MRSSSRVPAAFASRTSPTLTSALLLLALAFTSCGKLVVVSDGNKLPEGMYKPYQGAFAINGLRPGMTQAQCVKVLGKPTERVDSPQAAAIFKWASPQEVTVQFEPGPNGRASEVYGKTLTDPAGGALLVDESEEELKAVVPAASASRRYRPKGSGVISVGRELDATTYAFSDDAGKFEVWFDRSGMLVGMKAVKQQTSW